MVDLVPEFICCMWLGYVAKMRGHPAPSAKSAQTVLKYLLINDSDVVKAWRNRIYRYSSGTLFAKTTVELQDYLHDLNDPSALRQVIIVILFTDLTNFNVDMLDGRLYEIVGEVMFAFMKE